MIGIVALVYVTNLVIGKIWTAVDQFSNQWKSITSTVPFLEERLRVEKDRADHLAERIKVLEESKESEVDKSL